MLKALDFLARNNIVHRDIRPENILYEEREDGSFNLKLANFGLRIGMSSATHNAGINPYQAPEVLSCRAQTHAADMWCLFATLRTLADLYQPSTYSDYRSAWTALYSTAISKPQPGQLDLRCLREAIIWHVKYRGTAAQMLVKLYNGIGLASTGNMPELMAWDTWERLFGGREVTQHLYDGHMHALPTHIHGGTQLQGARVEEVLQVSGPTT
jgi:serine/threonine protein kinase